LFGFSAPLSDMTEPLISLRVNELSLVLDMYSKGIVFISISQAISLADP